MSDCCLDQMHHCHRFYAFCALMSIIRVSAFFPTQSVALRAVGFDRNVPIINNVYDDWRSDALVDTMHLDEENVEMCLQEFVDSDYGQQMFGCSERAASVGITGSIEFVELCGPEVTLSLHGKFWHRRDTVLGRAAMWLHARLPEVTDVLVEDLEDLKDFEDVLDDFGEVLIRKEKRSQDFNGDRATMEYQGMDPDVRGPFPQGPMGAGTMINPM